MITINEPSDRLLHRSTQIGNGTVWRNRRTVPVELVGVNHSEIYSHPETKTTLRIIFEDPTVYGADKIFETERR